MRIDLSHRMSRTTLCAALAVVALSLVIASCGDDDDDIVIPPDDFVFANDSAGAYTRVDRMGMPAVATAVITTKDAFNAGDPVDDGDFAGEITTNVGALHAALDDDLSGLGLTPCATNDCVGQAAPFVVPDVLRLNTAMASGFPNGRKLDDQVIDVTLALVLLDLGTHTVTTFADLPLNPAVNDLAFSASFPYLAPMNTNPVPDAPFLFATNPASAYTRVDRMGMPAVATAVITSKDDFNAGDPIDDGDFSQEILNNLVQIHAALDDDLGALALTPCPSPRCLNQLVQRAVPDVLRLDTSAAAGFPNGRRLPDQVIDITLALALLHTDSLAVTTFADIPLNPGANDVAFPATFPYLAPSQ